MKPYYYVYNTTKASPPTYKHTSLEGAETESLRLARKHPGEAFEILKCVGVSQISAANTFWMAGEEPRHRMLKDGEIITVDDEFEHPEGWRKHSPRFNSIGEAYTLGTHLPHRRPL